MNVRYPRWIAIARALCVGAAVLVCGHASASLPRGAAAPPFSLTDLDGNTVSSDAMVGRARVVVFGEFSHEGARAACADVLEALEDPRLADAPVTPILIIAQDVPVETLKQEAASGRYPAMILHDPMREAFGAYHVLVIPTIVVVDTQGTVFYSMPGYLQPSKSLLTDAILAATGREPVEQFERLIDPNTATESHDEVRADRLVHLGHELMRHGMYEMAEARFTEATSLVPGNEGAMLGLGELMIAQDRLDEAEPLFRSVLVAHPDSADAVIGIASVQLRRGGDGVASAQASIESLIEKDPSQPRARYVMGLIYERLGNTSSAAAEFKAAAELLLNR